MGNGFGTIMRFERKWGNFNSSDVGRITGVDGELLHRWCTQGLVPEALSGGIYDAPAVAEIMVTFDLLEYGVSPNECQAVSTLAARMILWFALKHQKGACEVNGADDDTRAFVSTFHEDTSLADDLAEVRNPSRYLVRKGRPTLGLQFVEDLAVAVCGVRTFLHIDLHQAAAHLASEAVFPLCIVKLHERPERLPMRRFTVR